MTSETVSQSASDVGIARRRGDEPAKVGILAGGGGLPLEVADGLKRAGRAYHIVGLSGFVDPGVEDHPHTIVGLGQLGRLLRTLREEGCGELVIIGTLARPDISKLRLDWGAIWHSPSWMALTHGGDDSLLRKVLRFFEGQGFVVRGAGDVVPDLLAAPGAIAGPPLSAEQVLARAKGEAALMALSRFDVGQAVVASLDGVIAFEDGAGTARMLGWLAERAGRAGDRVLVKFPKAGQELRIDTPTIGAKTVSEARAAGIGAIIVGAGATLVAERAAMFAAAEAAGMSVFAAVNPAGAAEQEDGTVAGPPDLPVLSAAPGARFGGDVQLGLSLTAAALAHAVPQTTSIAAVVRNAHVMVLDRDGLARGHLAARIGVLPRGWGLNPFKTNRGVVVVAVRDAAVLQAQLPDLIAAALRVRLAGFVFVAMGTLPAGRDAVIDALDRACGMVRANGLFAAYGIGEQWGRES